MVEENGEGRANLDNLKESLYKVEERVTRLEGDASTARERIARNEEKTLSVFDILKKIEESIVKISNKMDTVQERPNKMLEQVKTGTYTALIMIMVGLVLRYMGVM